jgi:hypothetical protein
MNGTGTCSEGKLGDGKCRCARDFTGTHAVSSNAYYGGDDCSLSRANYCSGHGRVTAVTTAAAATAAAAAAVVASVDPSNSGACTSAVAVAAASAKSDPSNSGVWTCECDLGTAHASVIDGGDDANALCGKCAPFYYGFPQCSSCVAKLTCSGHGKCSDDGCTCDRGYTVGQVGLFFCKCFWLMSHQKNQPERPIFQGFLLNFVV